MLYKLILCVLEHLHELSFILNHFFILLNNYLYGEYIQYYLENWNTLKKCMQFYTVRNFRGEMYILSGQILCQSIFFKLFFGLILLIRTCSLRKAQI